MCLLCDAKTPFLPATAASGFRRRSFVALAGAAALPAMAQVQVGSGSTLRNLVPAETLEQAAAKQYPEMMAQARAQQALAPDNHPQVIRLRAIAQRIIPFAATWNARARNWKWEVNLIGSKQVNAFCMPGGKIAFYTGILDQLKLSDDETAMVMGHEMAHALREHARARVAKTQATQMGVSIAAQVFGLGQVGQTLTGLGGQLLTLRFSRADETDADIVGLELAARAGYNPKSAVSLWQKMGQASGGSKGPGFLSTHPSGPNRIRELQANVPKVEPLYRAARRG